MDKSQSKYKSKPQASGHFTNEEKFDERETSPSTSGSISNKQPESPVDVTNIPTSEKTEGMPYIMV